MAIIQLVLFLAAGVLAAAQGHFYINVNNTYSPTPAPTHCECLYYTAANASDIAPDGQSCLYCSTCSGGHCTCLSNDDCKAIYIADAVKSFFGYILAAIAAFFFLACLGCIWECCIRPRIDAKTKATVSEYHLNAEPECHYQTVVMTQPTPVMVDQHVTFSINR